MEILIIKLGAIGDVLRTTSILQGLKKKFSKSRISWLTKKNAFPLLRNNALIDEIHCIEGPLENLKTKKYGIVISLDEEKEVAKLASELNKEKLHGICLEGGEVKYTPEMNDWFDMGLASRFGKERADQLKKLNKKTYQDIVASALGIEKGEIILKLGKENIEFAQRFKKENLDAGKKAIGLNTGAGNRWPMKKWSVENTAKLAERIEKELNAKVILFGGPEEQERNKKIIEKSKAEIIDAGCNNSLMEFAALVNLCDTVVCSDSLALHISIALEKYVVALFGPTSAAEIDIYNNGKKLITPSPCYCCYKKNCSQDPCLDLITVKEVFNSIKK